MNFKKYFKSEIPVGNLGNMATMLAVIAITVAIGAMILSNVAGSDTFLESAGSNASAVSALDALGTFGDWLVIIAIVIVAVVVLSLIKYL